ncbi:MAG: type II CRISPR RNA-guided endonuclease Cas9, partial [Bacteroidaceae bacterium]|nr:type II CRISPR RNA-guided endonuclease Cas9 [Bacteroidaceae bacterium]
SDEKKDFEKGKSITTNADRTLKRGMRRNLQRYKLRRENLIECLKENNIINNESILCECSNKSTFETYRLRAKAATEEVTLEQFTRILLMINKKRGYKSNRKAKSGDEGSLIDGMSIAKVLYDENLTPGQYVYKQLSQGGKYIPEFYRSDLKTEFDKVFDKQSEFYPDILTEETYNSLLEKGNRGTSNFFKEKFNILSADNKGENKKIQAYRWRSNAVSKQLPIEEVVYVLCEINGQLSNSSNYLGAIGDRSKELYFRHQTVGQALMQRLQEDPNASLKNIVYYRQDYLDEFERIWETQKAYHKELTEELKKEIRDIIIFYQRNLKSQKGLVSLCEFEQKKIEIIIDGEKKQKTIGRKVCPKSSPLFQEFKIWQILNNIEVTDYETGKNWFLNIEEKERLFKELNVRDKLKKSEVLKLLYKNHKELDLNYKEVEGNKTLSAIIRVCQEIITATGHEECDLSKLSSEQIYERINKIFSALNFSCNFLDFDSGAEIIEKEPMYRLWHLLYSYIGDNSKTG